MVISMQALVSSSQYCSLSNTQERYDATDALPLLIIDTPTCFAVISFQGAQLLEFQPKGDQPWLWLSPLANFRHGQAIRGGIPVCLPWFGVHQEDPNKPKHGFVRDRIWQLSHIDESPDKLDIVLDFSYDGSEPALFATAFSCQLRFCLDDALSIELQLNNDSSEAQLFSWALHSYLAVNAIADTRISGLNKQHYLDNTQQLKTFMQAGHIVFSGEVDRVYQACESAQTLETHHHLTISGKHCPSCIVWNPGEDLALQMQDVQQHFKDYVCVERGCSFEDSITLRPNQRFNSTMHIKKTA